MTRRKLPESRILITGASGGIGRELTIQLATMGARVLFTARRADRLHQLRKQICESGSAEHDVVCLTGDITDPNHRRQLVSTCQESFGGLDVLINNAGVGAVGPFADADPDRMRTLFEVNFFAAAELIRITSPLLRDGNTPAIVNIGSVLAHFAVPNKSEYCASKFALRGFSDSLRSELRGIGIDVLSVHPNTTKSEFFDQLVEARGDVAKNPMQMPADVAARKIIRAIQKGRGETVLSATGKFSVSLNAWFPSVMRLVLQRFG